MTDAALSPADALAQLTFLVQRILEERSAAHGMSVVQGRMLGILRDRTPLMSELGARLGLDKSSISGLVDRAEKRGLVERFRSPDDGRAVQVRLTDEGRARATAGEAEFDAEASRLLAHLPEAERTTLVRLISRLLIAEAEESGFDIR
ncbi:MarR family winged helix-turn-helix transcriptional regulator [Microbacterium sp. NPDC057944]|uniref:MarR family winged helix-turn-helix transcriptional regulator n=1 Tax=Microbacterium sp. NPDC057944 TaxID=3346286 RepID=UPI0036DEC201